MKKRKPLNGTDAIKINVGDGSELKYWAGKFGVTKVEIRLAVKEVGDSLTDVTQHFKLMEIA
jgi:hypothetical protein